MNLTRYQKTSPYSPASGYLTLLEEMDRLFDVAFPELTSPQRSDRESSFPVDLYQNKDAYTVRAELPGFDKEAISVGVADGVLMITGYTKTEKKDGEKEGTDAVQETRVSRAISLPENTDLEKIQAAYENGVLTVTLPKREEVKPRQIAVDVK